MKTTCFCALVLAVFNCAAGFSQTTAKHAGAHSDQPLPWYFSTAAIHRVSLKPNTPYWRFEHLSLKPEEFNQQLRTWKAEGIDAIEVFAPEEGGNSFDGLDAKDRYKLDPGVGTMSDFRRLISAVHSNQMHVVAFENLGYAATDAIQFQKAERDVRAGEATRESSLFFWSDSANASPPAEGDSYFFVRPIKPGYDAVKKEFWQWSEPAQHYYWTKWAGKDASGGVNHLPQYNWISDAWPTEARHAVNFWMSTGLDGMVVDAVNWYVGYTWAKNAQFLAEYRKFPGDKLLIPEGGGAFHSDDPVGWIKDGTWPALYDYGLDIWWEKQSRPMFNSVDKGDPGIFEEALRSYHDRVVAAGGVLIQPVLNMHDDGKQKLEEALLAISGDMLCYCEPVESILRPAEGIPDLLKLKAKHPALFQNSTRRRIATDHDQTVYAILRDAADNSERLLAVLNFSAEPVRVSVDAGAIAGTTYKDIESHDVQHVTGKKMELELPAYGHRLFTISDWKQSKAEEK